MVTRVRPWPAFGGVAAALALLTGGCPGPGPHLFPPVPAVEQALPDGGVELGFDSASDGRIDYRERRSPQGCVAAVLIDADRDGNFEIEAPWPPVDDGKVRHLVVMLDSIPFEIVREMWEHGRFRLFHPPVRTISPFPVLTDLSFAELFGVSPCPGCESEYFDGTRLTGGLWTYAAEGNSPWTRFTDYHLTHAVHSVAYVWPRPWYRHELGKIQRAFHDSDGTLFVSYVLSTSAIGHLYARDGHLAALAVLERFCRSIVHRTRGRVHITLLSDHGHNLVASRRIDLRATLAECGYNVSDRLEGPHDVVVPSWGLVTCAAVHTRSPARVAADLVSADGVELTAYREGGEVIVLSREGLARIDRSDAGYRYRAQRGDPLKLMPILSELAARGVTAPDGFVPDRALFDATHAHTYPDPLARLWRAFHGLVVNTPDVLVSLADGVYFGDPFMAAVMGCSAAHGNLNRRGSSGFAMTTAGRLPPALRMRDLHGALRAAGVPLPAQPAPPDSR